MEFDNELGKNTYKNRLSELLNVAICSIFDGSSTIKLVVTDCSSKISDKNDIQFMIPTTLYKKWTNSLSCDAKNEEKITQIIQIIKKKTSAWKISLSDISSDFSTILFKVNVKSLMKVLLKKYCSESLSETKHLPPSRDSCGARIIVCYLTDTSAIRTLLIASLLQDNHSKFLCVSKNSIQADVNLAIQSLNLDFHFETRSNADLDSILKVFVTSRFCHKEEGTTPNCYYILFHDECIDQIASAESYLHTIKNTKLFISSQVLAWIFDMKTLIFSGQVGNTDSDLKFCNVGPQENAVFSRQLSCAFLMYLENEAKQWVPLIKQLFSRQTDLFHGPVKTSSNYHEVLDSYRISLSESFASKYGEDAKWMPLVSSMAPSVLKLDILSVSLSTAVDSSLCDGGSTFAKFVMYNYCRISTILKNFDEKVQVSYYPPSPPLENIDFSLLQQENELVLIDQIWQFNDLRFTIFGQTSTDLRTFKPHSVVTYIKQLCRTFSTFYNRYHILGGNLPHLLPLMYARIYLIKLIQFILKKVFVFLKIVPLEHM